MSTEAHQLVICYECQHADSVMPGGTVHHGGQLHRSTFVSHASHPHVSALINKHDLPSSCMSGHSIAMK